MTILLTFKKLKDEIYGIQIEVLNEEESQNVFLDQSYLFGADGKWIDINKLIDEKFLDRHNVEIITDADGNIIPIGLVDFTNKDENSHDHLFVANHKYENSYKANQIIENIKKAIQIKYEAVKFLNRFDKIGASKVEEINLD